MQVFSCLVNPLIILRVIPMETNRKPYATPVLISYGAVSEITKQGSAPNADSPGGNDNTAYSV